MNDAHRLRYINDPVTADLAETMVFVGGPRGRPQLAVECKSGDRRASPACRYFRQRTGIPRFYQVHLVAGDFGRADSDTRVLPFAALCAELALP